MKHDMRLESEVNKIVKPVYTKYVPKKQEPIQPRAVLAITTEGEFILIEPQ